MSQEAAGPSARRRARNPGCGRSPAPAGGGDVAARMDEGDESRAPASSAAISAMSAPPMKARYRPPPAPPRAARSAVRALGIGDEARMMARFSVLSFAGFSMVTAATRAPGPRSSILTTIVRSAIAVRSAHAPPSVKAIFSRWPGSRYNVAAGASNGSRAGGPGPARRRSPPRRVPVKITWGPDILDPKTKQEADQHRREAGEQDPEQRRNALGHLEHARFPVLMRGAQKRQHLAPRGL